MTTPPKPDVVSEERLVWHIIPNCDDSEPLLVLHTDGRVTASEKLQPDENAARVIDSIVAQWPQTLTKAREEMVVERDAALRELLAAREEIAALRGALAETAVLVRGARELTCHECVPCVRIDEELDKALASMTSSEKEPPHD
jgi:hypothetical protein